MQLPKHPALPHPFRMLAIEEVLGRGAELPEAEIARLVEVLSCSRGLLVGSFGSPDGVTAADDSPDFPANMPPAEPDTAHGTNNGRSLLTDALGALAFLSQADLAGALSRETDGDLGEDAPIDEETDCLVAASLLIDTALASLGLLKDGSVRKRESYDGITAREVCTLVLAVICLSRKDLEDPSLKAASQRHINHAVALMRLMHAEFFVEIHGAYDWISRHLDPSNLQLIQFPTLSNCIGWRSKLGSPRPTSVSHDTLLAYITLGLLNNASNRKLKKEASDLRNAASYFLQWAPQPPVGIDILLHLFTLQFVVNGSKTAEYRATVLKAGSDALVKADGSTAYLASVAGLQLAHGDSTLQKKAEAASVEVLDKWLGKRRTVRDRVGCFGLGLELHIDV